MTQEDTKEFIIKWKYIPGTQATYSVNEYGQVRNNKTGRILSQNMARKGFYRFAIMKRKVHTTYITHLIMAKLFLPNPNNLPCIKFKNGNCADVYLDNLEWSHPPTKLNLGNTTNQIKKLKASNHESTN